MVSSLKVTRREFGTYDLLSPEGPAGSLRADGIRLDGFGDREAANSAADIASETLHRWHAARAVGAAHRGSIPDVTVDADSVTGLLAAGVATAKVAGGQSGAYAIEVPLAPGTWLATRLQLAQQVYGAIRERGLLPMVPAGMEAGS